MKDDEVPSNPWTSIRDIAAARRAESASAALWNTDISRAALASGFADGLLAGQGVYQGGLGAFIDERLGQMALRAPMWGGPEAIEAICFTYIEMFEHFCQQGPPRHVGPARPLFMQFARAHIKGRPGPMTLSQWFTDPKYGCAEAKKAADPTGFEHERWASQQIVQFFIAFKAHLVATAGVDQG